jgi:hypothetical protein
MMVASSFLLGCVLAIAQPPPADWTVETRLAKSQELVYRGTFSETATGSRVQCDRAFRVETRVFGLDTPLQAKGVEAGILTILRMRDNRPAQPHDNEASLYSVRLERVLIDLQGKVTPPTGVSLSLPLDGVPFLECGAFVEMPRGRLSVGQSWQVAEANRPLHSWQIVGTELATGVNCLKVVGTQQSDDWERPRSDTTAWRRTDTVWILPKMGYAARVERVLERREPGSREPNTKSVLHYELESSFPHSGNYADDCRDEITQALALRDAAAPCLQNPARTKEALNVLGGRIDTFLDRQTKTPYREALLLLKRRVEAAKKGEVPLSTPEEIVPQPAAEIGQIAPDFLAVEVASTKTSQLRKWQGRPVLLVFYHPASAMGPEMLPFAERLAATYPERISVLYLAMSDDAELIRKQRAALQLTQPALNGLGLRISYNVEATPKLVLLDSEQIVRGMWTGWGPQTPAEVLQELKQWLPKK